MMLRKIHLATGLFLLTFLAAYAVSAIDLAHREWFPHPYSTVEETRMFPPGIANARILAHVWKGELSSIETLSGILKFRVISLGRTVDVTYTIATGSAVVKTTTVSFLTTLAFIHVAQGIWIYAVAVVSLGLFVLGASGLFLWFKNHRERNIGIALLLIGSAIPLALIISMRY